jgi:predicted metal-dependent phosphotriesterase family hydrolase
MNFSHPIKYKNNGVKMNRRDFLQKSATIGSLSMVLFTKFAEGNSQTVYPKAEGKIMTVLGPIDPNDLGLALPHEHIMSQFGANPAETPVYDESKLYDAVIPYVNSVGELGADAVMDCTTAYFGRSPNILRTISQKTGVKILTNTGYYGAANDRYIPKHAFSETAEQLANRWSREMRGGIDGTGIRPGFIKIGVDGNGISEIDAKLVRAGAKAHLLTGLVVEVHTGDNVAGAKKQLEIFKEEGVLPSAWIWVHAHKNEKSVLLETAEHGAWIELDGVSEAGNQKHLELLNAFKQNNLLNRVLLSHDGNSFKANNKPPKPYDALFKTFMPLLKENGYSKREIKQLTVDNPREAFTIRVRKL